jgi:hypothetical protein
MPCTSRCETCEHVMARQAPAGLLGIHVNMPAAVPADSAQKAASTSGDVFQYPWRSTLLPSSRSWTKLFSPP